MPRSPLAFLLFLCVSLLLAACSSTPKTPHGKPLMKDGRYSSSYDAFVADPQYRFTRDIWYHDERIRQAQTRNSKIVIHLTGPARRAVGQRPTGHELSRVHRQIHP